jgi:hypothetical protein
MGDSLNTAERVVNFLRKNPGRVICDACLQESLGVEAMKVVHSGLG